MIRCAGAVFAAMIQLAAGACRAEGHIYCPDGASRLPDRSFVAAAREDLSMGPRLRDAAEQLSRGNRSVLLAALDSQGATTMMTVACSANDRFWSLLANLGLMRDTTADLADALRDTGAVAYELTDAGRQVLPDLLTPLFSP
ncbi:MAG: hypothetical protein AAGF88_12280 [Pseudomonadota bacterium]